jgi:hypothetical protein
MELFLEKVTKIFHLLPFLVNNNKEWHFMGQKKDMGETSYFRKRNPVFSPSEKKASAKEVTARGRSQKKCA